MAPVEGASDSQTHNTLSLNERTRDSSGKDKSEVQREKAQHSASEEVSHDTVLQMEQDNDLKAAKGQDAAEGQDSEGGHVSKGGQDSEGGQGLAGGQDFEGGRDSAGRRDSVGKKTDADEMTGNHGDEGGDGQVGGSEEFKEKTEDEDEDISRRNRAPRSAACVCL